MNSNFKIEDNILKGKKFSDPVINGYNSIGKFVLDRLESTPDFVGEIDTVTDEKYTYATMREKSVRCALWMKSQGLVPGDVITICSHNTLDNAMPCFAALYIGVALHPWDTESTLKNFQHLMNATKPKVAFVREESVFTLAEAAKQMKHDIKIITFSRVPGFLDFESLIGQASEDEVKNFECTPIKKPEEIALIMSTSGSTGPPKSVALSHGALLKQMYQSYAMGMADKVCLIFTSLSWLTASLGLFWMIYQNTPRLISPPFEEKLGCVIIKKYKVNWLFLPPSVINRLLRFDIAYSRNFSTVKRITCGGTALSVTSHRAFVKVVPHILVTTGYGSSELGGCLSVQSADSKPGSCGWIVENTQMKVIDVTSGQTLGSNQRGELLIKADTMMNFYYNDPEATAKTIDEEGWLHSGDLGYYDENGEIFVVDRLKELIKYRSYHVSPYELETILLSHPGVKHVAVVGRPHPVDDEHPIAFVVRDSGREVTETELVDLVASEVSENKWLRGGVIFIDEMPYTTSGKIERSKLRQWARSEVANDLK